MSNLYQISYKKQLIPFNGKVNIYASRDLRNGTLLFHAFCEGKLLKYEYNAGSDFWRLQKSETLVKTTPSQSQILDFPNTLHNGILTLKTSEGIEFYRYDDDHFRPLAKTSTFIENEFNDLHGWQDRGNVMKTGYFYHNNSLLGLLTYRQEQGLKLYAVMTNELLAGRYPIRALKTNQSILGNLSNVSFHLADLQRKGQESIIINSKEGLNIYLFNQRNGIEHSMRIPSGGKEDTSEEKLLFPNLSGQSYQDIVLMNSSGLFVFQYSSMQNNYEFIYYNPMFAKLKGWNSDQLSSVRFEDVDSDGRDDMLFTGPAGVELLSFDIEGNTLTPFLDNSMLNGPELHGHMVNIISANQSASNNPIIFTQYRQTVHWGSIVEARPSDEKVARPETIDETVPEVPTVPVIPQLVQSHQNGDNTISYLKDTLDCSPFFDAVDKNTGKINLKLHLVDLSSISSYLKLNLYYAGNSQVSGILGVSWSLPQSFIVMDHRSSIFPEDEMFYMFLDDYPQPLIRDTQNSTETITSFKMLNDQNDVNIRYFNREERWEVSKLGTKQIFGRTNSSRIDPINWELVWENWRGVGSSSIGQKPLATGWFLSEVSNERGDAVQFKYDVVSEAVHTGKRFTKELYLKAVSDNRGNTIVLKYSFKDENEIKMQPVQSDEDYILTQKVQTRYLSGYSAITKTNRQDIKFEYKIDDGKRMLNAIIQENDPLSIHILQFNYRKISNSYMMDKVILPTEAKVEFNYETIGAVSEVTEQIGRRFYVPNYHRVDPGDNDVLISYITDEGQVALRMFDTEMTTEQFSSVSDLARNRIKLLGRGSVSMHEVVRAESFIAVILHYSTDKELYLLSKEDGKWLTDLTCFTFSDDTTLRYGRDFIVVAEVGSFIEIISWSKEDTSWTREMYDFEEGKFNKPVLVKTFDRMFLVYDDNILWIGFKDFHNKWKSKVIKRLPGLVKRINDTFHEFDLTDALYEQLFSVFKTYAMQFNNNLLLLNSLKLEGTQLYTVTHLIVLDRDYNAAHVQEITQAQDNLNNFSRELEGNNGTFFTLGYNKDTKFKLVVKNMRGPIFDEMHKNLTKEQEESSLKEVRVSVLKSVGKAFIINLSNYTAVLSSQTALCGGKMYTFNGELWLEKKAPVEPPKSDNISVLLGDKLVLLKENEHSSLKLYNQGSDKKIKGNSLLDLEVKHLNQSIIKNMYPVYLAYQEKNKRVGVVEFSPEGNIYKSHKITNKGDLSPWSSYQTLVTREMNTLVFRQQLGLKKLLPNPVIKNVDVYFNGAKSKRTTGYDYDVNSAKVIGNTIYYSVTTFIPGNEKKLFGWIQETRDSHNYTVMEKKVFGAQGDLIKYLKETKQNDTNNTETDNDNLDVNHVLLDKAGKLKVAQFSPYTMADEEVGYYGFEHYETNVIGQRNSTIREKQWLFKEPNVVNQGFALSGKNFLRLAEGSLQGLFEPKNQYQNYVASCWIRPNDRSMSLGDVAPCLKAVVYNKKEEEIIGLLGEVKYQFSEWFYLEVAIDVLYLKQLYKGLLASPNSTFTDLEGDTLKLFITIVPEANSTVDVDHVRFSPLNSNFEAHVYDPNTGLITASINANGLITRQLYDKYQVQIASINEQGRLESLSTYNKASSRGIPDKMKTKVNVQPETGFYEDFSPSSFQERWNIQNAEAWRISPGYLHHTSNNFDTIRINPYEINSESYGIRLCFSLQSEITSLKLGNDIELVRKGSQAHISIIEQNTPIPVDGEILIVAEYKRLFVWVDGGLYFDSFSSSSVFNWKIRGQVKISDVMVFSKPQVQVDYLNELDDLMQKVILEGENSVIVTGYLYDELGRGAITTQPVRLQRSKGQPLLRYYGKLTQNCDPNSKNSVWKTGRLKGEITNTAGEYGYHRIKYNNNPLNEKIAVGMPGEEFSITGPYAKRYDSSTQNKFIMNYFPVDQNYRYLVEHIPGNISDISVYDNKNNKVAWYSHAPNRRSLLSTYEYNDNNKVVKSLPPEYHVRARTTLTPFQNKIEGDKYLQDKLGTHTSYDAKGNLVSINTPDAGKVEYLYDTDDLLRYIVYYSNDENEGMESVTYFNYDGMGRLTGTGKLRNPPPAEKLFSSVISTNDMEEYQQFQQSDNEREPILRGNVERTITFNNGEPLVEESILSTDRETLSKRILVPVKGDDKPLLISIDKIYLADELKVIEYPTSFQGQQLKIVYSHNKLGKITVIGIQGYKTQLLSFNYNSAGLLTREEHLPETSHNFTREYSYNAPGFLTELKDKFLTETVDYTSGSYGGHGYGDGTVTRTKFQATWHQSCDNDELELNEQSFVSENLSPDESALCFRKLKERGYLNESNRQAKMFYPSLEVSLPTVCSYGVAGRQIQHILGTRGFPSPYGHSYDYGNHRELTKAKYFVGKEPPSPLQPSSFSNEILGIDNAASFDIWSILTKDNTYLVSDIDKIDDLLSHTNQGKSLIRPNLFSDLKNVGDNLGGYKLPLERYLLFAYSQRQNIALNIKDAFLEWNGGIRIFNVNQTTNKVIEMLDEKKYFQNPLNEEYVNILRKYKNYIPDITRVLLEHFGKQLGEAEFDVQSYNIDANGNHKIYYTGFDGYELTYSKNTNQVSVVKNKSYTSSRPEKEYAVRHDSRGNIVQALHKGIHLIDYHPVSNRATKMHLTNGETVSFYYDTKGERILKRLANNRGETTKEKHYLRDEHGRVLVERQLTYLGNDSSPDILVTAYIYGPRGLIGFIRRDEFFSVITDHEGSVRLVVKGSEVVSSYDYLPYGGMMREYGPDPESHISYRYTGQEWDEELGLYNYHARFYDPSIGRFYQIDPKMQYFSPYKYAGNSPVSVVDPNGEVAFLIVLPFILLGAYLGGAAANDNWNPIQWKFNAKTMIGVALGGLAGAFIPIGAASSFGFLTGSVVGMSTIQAVGTMSALSLGGAYLSTAALHNEWDLTKFNYTSPKTSNAMFQGISTTLNIVGGVKSAKEFYSKLETSFGKGVFITATVTTGGGIFIATGLSKKWGFSKPGMYQGMVDAFVGSAELPMFLRGAARFMHKNARNVKSSFRSAIALYSKYRTNNPILSNIREILRETNSLASLRNIANKRFSRETVSFLESLSAHRFPRSVGNLVGGTVIPVSMAVFLGSETGFDFNDPTTYLNIVRGMIFGGQRAANARKYYKEQSFKNIYKRAQGDTPPPPPQRPAEKALIVAYTKAVVEGGTRINPPEIDHPVITNGQRGVDIIEPVPNRAIVSVALTNELAIVKFETGTTSPRLVLFIDRNLNSVSYLHYFTNNNPITRDRLPVYQSVHGAVRSVQEHRRADLAEQLVNEMKSNGITDTISKGFQKITGNEILSKLVSEQLVKQVKTHIKNAASIKFDKIDVDLVLKKFFEMNVNALNQNLGLTKNNNKVSKQEVLLDNEPLNQVVRTYFGYPMKSGTLLVKSKDLLDLKDFFNQLQVHRNELVKIIWNDVGGKIEDASTNVKIDDLFPPCYPTNCAKPGSASVISRPTSTAALQYKRGRVYTMDDITYSFTYIVPNPSRLALRDSLLDYRDLLSLFERNGYSKIITSRVKNVMTDSDWNDQIDNIIKDLNSKFVSNKRLNFNFLKPYNQLAIRMPKKHGQSGYFPERPKRSLEQNMVEFMPMDQNSSAEYERKFSSPVQIETPRSVRNVGSSTVRPNCSFMNTLSNWVARSTNEIYSFVHKKHSNYQPNTLPIDSKVDVNSTILLFDLLVRKFTGKKCIPTAGWDGSLMQAQVSALNLTEEFERKLRDAAVKSGIPLADLNFDPVPVQSAVFKEIRNGKHSKIHEILYSFAKQAYSKTKHDEQFLAHVNKSLEVILEKKKLIPP